MTETANAFTVDCTSCSTTFPVDPAKVPDGGVLARCSVCEGVFRVEVPSAPAVEDLSLGDAAPATAPATESFTLDDLDLDDEPAAAAPSAASGFADADALPEADDALPPDPLGIDLEPAPASSPPVFGKRDPMEKAQRLARVLVSDMITYNSALHQKALAEKTLAADFDEEIKKSWAQFVEEVGEDVANSTPFFNEALNEILARGESIF